MVADGMLTRQRYREVPPRVDYELTPRAQDLLPVLAELARWGYEWAWSAPRSEERVDVGAIFRLAGGLLSASDTEGQVEFTVTDADPENGPALFTISLEPTGVKVSEEPAAGPIASASGSTADWVRVFTPAPDLAGLAISGDQSLVRSLLAELAQERVQLSARARDAESDQDGARQAA